MTIDLAVKNVIGFSHFLVHNDLSGFVSSVGSRDQRSGEAMFHFTCETGKELAMIVHAHKMFCAVQGQTSPQGDR